MDNLDRRVIMSVSDTAVMVQKGTRPFLVKVRVLYGQRGVLLQYDFSDELVRRISINNWSRVQLQRNAEWFYVKLTDWRDGEC